MEQRTQIDKVEPKAYEGMFALEKYLSQSTLDKGLVHLLKIRASQINGCAFCINMHTQEALSDREDPKRIFLLDAWEETDMFTEMERAVLRMTEEVTLIHKAGLTSDSYDRAANCFTENEISQIIMAIVTINAWNRIAIATRKPF
ncbi:MAG: carboxymuconolactone decarboxylase family protein [Muricauda sp. TMED12]|nr:MAG: carboxymuconolactone decarboxylase family protein [Muricauda sp. TMED12]